MSEERGAAHYNSALHEAWEEKIGGREVDGCLACLEWSPLDLGGLDMNNWRQFCRRADLDPEGCDPIEQQQFR